MSDFMSLQQSYRQPYQPILPAPNLLLGGTDFDSWYPGQDVAVSGMIDWMSMEQRFMCASLPAGSGKSLAAIVLTILAGKRVVILTATKGLQAQIGKDFPGMVVDIRGQNSYQCKLEPANNCDEGPCRFGYSCQYRNSGCLYYDKVKKAQAAQIIVTNYAYWIAQNAYSDGFGEDIGLLICDEAHLEFEALSGYLTSHITLMDVEMLGLSFPIASGLMGDGVGVVVGNDGEVYENVNPGSGDEIESKFDKLNEIQWDVWVLWAVDAAIKASIMAEDMKEAIRMKRDRKENVTRAEVSAYQKVVVLEKKLNMIVNSMGRWIGEKEGTGWTFSPVWVDDYVDYLYLDVPKVMLMSATLTRESVKHLGIKEEEMVFMEMPSYFPPENTPIIHIDTIRINHRSTKEELIFWLGRIDQIISGRMDRKGIVFTVSYERRNQIITSSQHRDIMMSHGQKDVVRVVNKFKDEIPPKVLVSPTVTTGFDFPGECCEYIIVGKLPYPDTRSLLMKARLEDDPDWSSFLAMQTIVQESSRGSRSPRDICEVLLIDDNWKWFWKRYQKYAPLWFQERVRGRSVSLIPVPPPRQGTPPGQGAPQPQRGGLPFEIV